MADYSVRGIPDDLYATLKEAADRNHRSLNGEILARLQASVMPRRVDVDALLDRVRSRTLDTGGDALDEELLRILKDAGRL